MNKITTLFFGIFLSIFVIQAQAQVYIWGGPGDANSEFADGLNDWTVEGWATANGALVPNANAVFSWEANGSAENGLFAGATAVIQSPSVGNGAMVFNSDFMDTRGTGLGTGAALRPQRGHLTSPEFSCEGHSSVVVHFNQTARQFQSAFFLDVTVDGTNWTAFEFNIDPFPVQRDIKTNRQNYQYAADMIDITSVAANQPNVQIRFRAEANLYFWIIDDVWVMENPDNDLVLGECLYSPSNYTSPSMTLTNDSMFFASYIYNRGAAMQTGIEVQAFILDANQALVYTASQTVDQLAVGDTAIVNFDDAKAFIAADLPEGSYLLGYNLTTDAGDDYNTSDNVYLTQFNVSADVYEKTFPRQSTAYRPSGADDFGFASIFVTGEDGDKYEANSAVIGLAANGDLFGAHENYISWFLLELNEDFDDPYFNTFDFDETGIDANDNFTVIGSGEEILEGKQAFRTFESQLFNDEDDSKPLCLKSNRTYFLLGNIAGLEEGTAFVLFDEGTVEWHQFETVFPKAQLTYLILNGEDWGGGFGGTTGAPIMNMQLTMNEADCDMNVGSEDTELPQNSIVVSPNPAIDHIMVDLNFTEVNSGAMVMTNVDGKVMVRREFKDVQKSSERFNVDHLPAGSYMMNIFSDQGQRAIPFIVK